METMDDDELISALADGQLRGSALARAVALAAGDRAGRSTWQAYQTVGEVLRCGEAARGNASSEAFLARLQAKLQAETVHAQLATVPEPIAVVARAQESANDWRWKLVAGVASVAAVAAIGWNMAGPALVPAAQPQLAALPVPAPAPLQAVPGSGTQQATMIRDPRIDQLLAAHRELGGAIAWQSTSGFLRNATFEGPAR